MPGEMVCNVSIYQRSDKVAVLEFFTNILLELELNDVSGSSLKSPWKQNNSK